ncbi:AsmA-like C-terminal region-containing protein [Hymenobacter sp. GOD-10R]|uniref:AsmA family protein n=1 Tax=Hymenobacter sp. GOD-10R TaxID=3093922 RepID=UPI002D798CF7|nr:AsmA-like C-terminal region-containing protein [Hymenobacter sp. GOD-10R]WRQ28452.1 AsmA-like C-terminal region-containing protein [Hymenobacter sp. GOD-10R]
MLLGLLVLLGSVFLGMWLGKDHIIGLFVQEANEYLRTPVRVSKIDLSLIDQFPRVSITLHNVVVSGSLPQDTVPLARVRTLYCAFDVWDLIARRYRVRAVSVLDGQVQVRLDAQGKPNYDVIKTSSTGDETSNENTSKPFAFALENVRVRRVAAVYTDFGRQQRITTLTSDLRATLALENDRVMIRATGATHVQAIRLGDDEYVRDKYLQVKANMVVDRHGRMLTLNPSEVQIGPAAYGVVGTIGYGGATKLDLRFNGHHTNVQSVVALLPPRMAQRYQVYRSKGDVYFRGTVRGLMTSHDDPRVEVRFGCRDASFYHEQYAEGAEHVFLTGTFNNGNEHALRTSALALAQVRGTLQGRPFSGDLRYENFVDPSVQVKLQADLDVGRVLGFYPVAAIRSGSGEAKLAFQFAGNLRQFRTQPTAAAVQSVGELTLKNVRLQLRDFAQSFTNMTGTFHLQHNDVNVPHFTGRLGRSDFQLKGVGQNGLGWLLLPRQPLVAKATFTSSLLDFDQLLRVHTAGNKAARGKRAPAKGDPYEFTVSPTLSLDLNTSVRRVRFRRFRGRDLRGIIKVHNQVVSSPNLGIAAITGHATVRGYVDARQSKVLKVSTTMGCSQLPLDSLFYVFENFGQNFITARHLRGSLTASAESDMYFDRQLTPLTDRLEAEVKATVRNGELNNFQPLQKLSMLASREKLRHLLFAELTNNFYIQSRTVYLPEMEVRSNVRTASLLRVTGTHTFDQQIDYHLSIPLLPGLLRRANGTATGPSLLLAIQGTEDNFRVSYDRARAQANRATISSNASAQLPEQPSLLRRATTTSPLPAQQAKPAEPRKLFEVKKPEKKPTQPQPGEDFGF